MAISNDSKRRWREAERIEGETGLSVVANTATDDDYEIRIEGLTESEIKAITEVPVVREIIQRASARVAARDEV